MSRGVKKPRVRMKSINASKTQKLSGFFDYLTQPGHQTENNEIPEVYTNLEDSSAVGIKRFLDQYEKNFQNAMKSGALKNNCKLVAKSMVFALPNEMTKTEIDGYVKAISDALPEYMTFAFAVHRGSNKKTRDSQKNLHLQGFLGIRGEGAEKFGADVRLPLHENLVKASDAYIKKIGFKIKYDPTKTQPCAGSLRCLESEAFKSAIEEGLTGNRALKTRQSELLRDSMWLTNFSKREDINDPKLKQFCSELAMKRIRINAEKFQKKSGFDLEFVSKNLSNSLKIKVAAEVKAANVAELAKSAKTTIDVVKLDCKLPLQQRLQPIRETFDQHTYRLRLEQENARLEAARAKALEEAAGERAAEEITKRMIEKLQKMSAELQNNPSHSYGGPKKRL